MSSVPSINPGYPSDRPQIVGRIGKHHQHHSHTEGAAPADKSDTVELSNQALAAAANQTPDVDSTRADRLAQIKAQIQAGTYDEDAKLTVVADRLAKIFGNG
jgi:flagellar biosynthesis anti-sigma factor FlgM